MSRTTEVIEWAIEQMDTGMNDALPNVKDKTDGPEVLKFFTAGDSWILHRCGLDPEGVLPFAMAQSSHLLESADVAVLLRAHGLAAIHALMGAAFMQGVVVGSIAAEQTKGAERDADA